MLGYIIQRVMLVFPTLFVITVLSFAISRLAPGDPAELKAGVGSSQNLSTGQGKDLNEKMIALIRKQWNLDKPLFYFSFFEDKNENNPKSVFKRFNIQWHGVRNQYHIWTSNVLKFDFGNSFRDNQPVLEKIKERIPITITLNLISTLIAYLVAIPLGVFSAVIQDSLADRVSTVTVFILYSLLLQDIRGKLLQILVYIS